MADNNILIKLTAENNLDELQKALQDATARAEEYEKQILRLKDAEKADAKAIKELGLSEKDLAKQLQKNREYYRQEINYKKDDIEATKKSIKSLNDMIKTHKLLDGSIGKATQQLRAMRERLMEMEDAGEFGTQAFVDLSIAAAKLEDKIGDTQQRIRILASDTKNMDAVMGLGEGLAGTFYIATSGAEIFGDNLEGLQQAFYKVQAAMSILSGTQQVYNALQKDSAVAVVFGNGLEMIKQKHLQKSAAYERLYNIQKAKSAALTGAQAEATLLQTGATNLWTKAQWKLNAALAANPIGVILAGIIALVAVIGGAIYAYQRFWSASGKAARKAEEAQRLYNNQVLYTSRLLQKYSILHEQEMNKIEDGERKRLNEAKKRHASQTEINKIELDALKAREKEVVEYTNKAIIANNAEIKKAREAADAENKLLSTKKKGSKAWYEQLEKVKDAEQQYYDAVRAGISLESEREEAHQAVFEKEEEIAEQSRQLVLQEQQARLDMMRDGQGKEIAQIKANLKEQLRQYEGNSKEEIAMRKALREKAAQEIADIERKYTIQEQQTLTEIAVKAAEERTKKLTGAEGVEEQIQVWEDYYAQRRYQIEENARLEAEEVQRSTDSEELKAAKIEQIEQRVQAELTALAKEGAEKRIEINSQELTALEIAADKAAFALEHTQGTGRLDALKANLDAQLDLYEKQGEQLDAQWEAGTIKWEEYERQKWEITKAMTDARTQYELEKMQEVTDGFQKALGHIQEASDLVFEALSNNVQAELDALDEMYTTDYEEAKNNANKKYVTEEEYERKKAELEEKQAKYAKAQAIANAVINTALAIVTTIGQLGATPWGIAGAVIAAAMGAAQIAVITSQSLAQYEKGRKGGKGEYAIVGEKGPEIMYVPEGASIVPNNYIATPDEWEKYGVPKLSIPELPSANTETLRYAAEQTGIGQNIDYDRFGASVAKHLPKQQGVTVNVDRTGVHVSDGGNNHSYLNTKYAGSWP